MGLGPRGTRDVFSANAREKIDRPMKGGYGPSYDPGYGPTVKTGYGIQDRKAQQESSAESLFRQYVREMRDMDLPEEQFVEELAKMGFNKYGNRAKRSPYSDSTALAQLLKADKQGVPENFLTQLYLRNKGRY